MPHNTNGLTSAVSTFAGAGRGVAGLAAAGAKVGTLIGGPPGAAVGAGIGAGVGFVVGGLEGFLTSEELADEKQRQKKIDDLNFKIKKQKMLLSLLASARQRRIDASNIKRIVEADKLAQKRQRLGDVTDFAKLIGDLRTRSFKLSELNRLLGRT